MSMIVTTVSPEGIVMAADSAMSAFKMVDLENFIKGNVHEAISNTVNGTCAHKKENVVGSKILSKSITKLHVMKNNCIAIAEGNQRSFNNTSLQPYLESFCEDDHYENPESCARSLLQFIKDLGHNIHAEYHVCGYNLSNKIPLPEFWHVDTAGNSVLNVMNGNNFGISFSGANEYFSQYAPLIDKNIMSYSLQDAIDVTMFAIDMSIKLSRFIDREEFISPPIDLLVIKPTGVKWIQQKTLKGDF